MWTEYDIATSDNRPYFFRPWPICPVCGRCHCGKSSHCFSEGPKPDYQVHYISYAVTADQDPAVDQQPEPEQIRAAEAKPKEAPPKVYVRSAYRGDSKLEKVTGSDWEFVAGQACKPTAAKDTREAPVPDAQDATEEETIQDSGHPQELRPVTGGTPRQEGKPQPKGLPGADDPSGRKKHAKGAGWFVEYDVKPGGYESEDGGWGHEEAEDEPGQEDESAQKQPAGQPEERQAHVHEYHGTVKLDDYEGTVHNHRVAGVSGEAIRTPLGHAHKIWARTDFFDHFHWVSRLSGPAVYVGSGKPRKHANVPHYEDEQHVHYVDGLTSINDGHNHEYQFATLIDSPLLPEPPQR